MSKHEDLVFRMLKLASKLVAKNDKADYKKKIEERHKLSVEQAYPHVKPTKNGMAHYMFDDATNKKLRAQGMTPPHLSDDQFKKQQQAEKKSQGINVDKAVEEAVGKGEGLEYSGGPLKKNKVLAGSVKNVQNILQEHGIDDDSDELAELANFKQKIRSHQRLSQKEFQARARNVRGKSKLKEDFIKNMDPKNYTNMDEFKRAQERFKEMPSSDFGKILAAIMSEEELEEDEGAKKLKENLSKQQTLKQHSQKRERELKKDISQSGKSPKIRDVRKRIKNN